MRRRLVIVVFLLPLVFASCHSAPRRRIVLGSKNFTEQIVLAEILAQHIRSHTTIEVEERVNLGGTLICHQAIRAGAIDLYVEYTGTALTAVLGESPSGNSSEVYARVKRDYASRFGLE